MKRNPVIHQSRFMENAGVISILKKALMKIPVQTGIPVHAIDKARSEL